MGTDIICHKQPTLLLFLFFSVHKVVIVHLHIKMEVKSAEVENNYISKESPSRLKSVMSLHL